MSERYTCEASAATFLDHVGKPMVRYCGKEAKLHGMAAMCDEHWEWHLKRFALVRGEDQ